MHAQSLVDLESINPRRFLPQFLSQACCHNRTTNSYQTELFRRTTQSIPLLSFLAQNVSLHKIHHNLEWHILVQDQALFHQILRQLHYKDADLLPKEVLQMQCNSVLLYFLQFHIRTLLLHQAKSAVQINLHTYIPLCTVPEIRLLLHFSLLQLLIPAQSVLYCILYLLLLYQL